MKKNEVNNKKKETMNKMELFLTFILTISIMCNGALSAFIYSNKDKLLKDYIQVNAEQEKATLDNAFYKFDESFLVKLKDNSYLKIGINLGYDSRNKQILKEIEENLPKLKDKTLAIFINEDKNSFKNDNLEKIKNDLLKEYNGVLRTGKINNLYFTELIQQ